MRAKLFTLGLILLLSTSLAAQTSGTCGANLTWTLSNGVLTIRGSGPMNDYTSTGPWYENRSSISRVVIGNGVTSIGDYAFRGCSALTFITISNSVTSIGDYAFHSCSALVSITIPNSVTSIGGYAFQGCFALASIVIPNSVISIGNFAFLYCSSLTSITIPNSVKSIGIFAFNCCSSLTNVSLSDSATNIGEGAFYDCPNLPVENNLRYADYYLVEAVDKTLTNYTIKNGTKWIGQWAFYECSNMTSVSIPNTVTRIDRFAFGNCSNLPSINIPNSVTRIESGAFQRCTSLTSFTIPNSVTSIGGSAFFGCSGLTSIVIPNGITRINPNTFVRCKNLTTVSIPSSVTSVGADAFGGCDSISQVYVYNPNPIVITDVQSSRYNVIFYYSADHLTSLMPKNLTIYIPCESLNAYQTTEYWSDYASRMAVLPFPNVIYNANDSIRGSVNAIIPQTSCDSAVLTAIPNYGYYFSKWSDNTTSNPYVLYATQDPIITAIFEKNTYTLHTQVNNPLYGTTVGDTTAYYLDTITVCAIPNIDYSFSRWSDGYTNNPRKIVLTKDTTFTAEFKDLYSGQCGDSLSWNFSGDTLYISGNGEMYNYPSGMPWAFVMNQIVHVSFAPDMTSITEGAFYRAVNLCSVVIPDKVSGIESRAFLQCSELSSVSFGAELQTIGDYAFAYCGKIHTMTSYNTTPPTVGPNVFRDVPNSSVLYVPSTALDAYKQHPVWGVFDVRPLDSAIDAITGQSPSHPQKILRNNQLYILLPDGTRYTATGQLCK